MDLRIMQLAKLVTISLAGNPVASPVMATDPKSGWERAASHKRKGRGRRGITIPLFAFWVVIHVYTTSVRDVVHT